ncbi:MAG: acetylglutamate kinase [Candidatus Gastranaerophilales bacterium]|nr:acetylglutamate kinase [Candidatus Gastranaerophilales bacterium]
MDFEKYIKKAETLVEAMPYINKFNGKTVVIKYGGSAMTDENIKHSVIGDIAYLKAVGINPVVVHGGGPAINATLKTAGIESEFKNGLRITDEKTVKTVEEVLSGMVNKSIVSDFQKHDTRAVGISGKDGLLIEALKSPDDIGFVGEIFRVNPQIIQTLLDASFIPVISPIGTDKNGETYNINADHAAVEIAIALKANKLVFMTDTDGVRKDENDPDSLLSKITPAEIDAMIKDKSIKGGMIPKVKSCARAIKSGVKAVHIINGKIKHSLLLEIYTKDGVGTVIEEK